MTYILYRHTYYTHIINLLQVENIVNQNALNTNKLANIMAQNTYLSRQLDNYLELRQLPIPENCHCYPATPSPHHP